MSFSSSHYLSSNPNSQFLILYSYGSSKPADTPLLLCHFHLLEAFWVFCKLLSSLPFQHSLRNQTGDIAIHRNHALLCRCLNNVLEFGHTVIADDVRNRRRI